MLARALARFGATVRRGHPFKTALGHGFIATQSEGIEVFRTIDPDAPLIVAEAVWQYSQNILADWIRHRGPILTVANWSGTWQGLAGLLNLNGSLTKAGVAYSTLWSVDFSDDWFLTQLEEWLTTGHVTQDSSHGAPFDSAAFRLRWLKPHRASPRRCDLTARSWACLTGR